MHWTATARFMILATFRRDGREVRTPVWFAKQGNALFVFSAGKAGKIKRLRRCATVRVAPCDVRGRTRGPWDDGEAVILASQADMDVALAALRRKYGLSMWLTDLASRLTGRFHQRAYIRVHLRTTDSSR